MNISDEKLGAFLDQELPERDMEAIRDAIQDDAALAERLAVLASADALLKRHAAALDARPMPDAVMKLLQPESTKNHVDQAATTDNVVQLSRWQKTRRQTGGWIRQHAALAAGIALVVGFTGGQFLDPEAARTPATTMLANNLDATVSDALDNSPSGEAIAVYDNASLLSRFSFVDQQARHCRQFVLESTNSTSENVACRVSSGWELVASAQATRIYTGDYQTASDSSLLDSTLDAMMAGAALSLEEENALIQNQWQ
ncbi:MAG: hypothetical protein WD600_05860 [Pseudohongiella sp.]